MVFNEKANGRVTTSGLLLVVMLGVLIIPRWTIGQVAPPSVTPPATAAEEPAAPPLLVPSITTPVPAPTIEAAPPSSATAPAADPVPAISAATAPSPADSPAEEPLALVKVQLADGQSMLHLGTTEDGMLSIEIERDGKIVERHLLPLAVQRADNRARAARRRTITVAPEGGAAYPPSGLATRPAFPSRARTTIAADPNATPQIVQQQHPSTVPAPQGIRYSVPSVNVADLDLLKLDCELAQVTVEKRKVELDEAKETETRSPGTVPATKIKLLELSIREAELELRKCQLKLESASRQQERQAEPEAARR